MKRLDLHSIKHDNQAMMQKKIKKISMLKESNEKPKKKPCYFFIMKI